jgi:hypothetical protein
VAAILTSRFLLDLRYIHEHPNGTTGHSISLPRFNIPSQLILSNIVTDFGSPVGPSTDRETASEPIGTEGNVTHEGEVDSPGDLTVEYGGILDHSDARDHPTACGDEA